MDINHLNLIMVEQNKQKEYRENFNRNYSEILKRLLLNTLRDAQGKARLPIGKNGDNNGN